MLLNTPYPRCLRHRANALTEGRWLRSRRARFFSMMLALLAAGSAPVGVASTAGVPAIRESLEADARVLENPNFDLLVLEIEEARGGQRGLPLEARVRVLETLRGRLEEGVSATATWDQYGRWAGKELERPDPGTRFLAGGISAQPRNGPVRLRVVDAYEASTENIEIAKRHMEPPEPSPWPVVALAVASWALLGVSMLPSASWWRWPAVAGAMGGAVATVAVYYNYERAMSPYTTIRFDVFLVWPAVCMALALPIAVLWLLYRWKREGAARV